MDAFEILKNDHRQVSKLFGQIELAEGAAEKRRLFELIRQELELHAYIEETVFYPLFADEEEFREIIEDSLDDHQEIKDLLLEVSEATDERELDRMLDEVIGCVEQHVEEEEDELFPRIEKALDTVQLMQIGAQLEEAKKSLPTAA